MNARMMAALDETQAAQRAYDCAVRREAESLMEDCDEPEGEPRDLARLTHDAGMRLIILMDAARKIAQELPDES